jgi:hypothetical protein
MKQGGNLKRTGFKRKPEGKKLARTGRLATRSKSSVSTTKERIQSLIRARAIERDGGCVLRHYAEAGECGWLTKDGELILQGEHLNGRSNSVSYGEMENIVCLCINHHFNFKKYHSNLYWILIRRHLGEKRWKKVEGWILDRSAHRFTALDWKRVEEALSTS